MPVGRGPATYPLRCVSVIMTVGDVAQSAPFSSPQLSDPDMIDSLRRSIMEGLTIQTCAFRRCLDHTRKFRHAQLALRLILDTGMRMADPCCSGKQDHPEQDVPEGQGHSGATQIYVGL